MKKYIFAALLLSIILCSCENFLQGADTKQKLERVVSYANAPGCTVALRSDESMGTFVAGDSKEFKVGVDEDIYFTANIANCYFAGLKAVSISDSAKDMSEYVEIKLTERDDQKGLYKINVTILKQAPDIVLTPVCYFYPEVVSYTPSGSNASFANMPVVITFNVPMEKEEVTPVQSIFNYDNISLKCGSTDVSSYFEKPYFNNQKTVLTLKPKADFLEALQSTNEQIINMDITFGENIYVTVDNIKLQIKQNEKGCITVTYKPESETIPPVKTGFGFFASKEELPLETILNMSDSERTQIKSFNYQDIKTRGNLSMDEYTSLVMQNRTQGVVYLYGRYFDADSGVKAIRVLELHSNDKTGNYLIDEKTKTIDYFLDDSENIEYKVEGKTVSFRIKHILPDNSSSKDNNDGLFNLAVSVLDDCYNGSVEESFIAVKDSFIGLSQISVYNIFNDESTGESDEDQRMDKAIEYIIDGSYYERLKTIKFLTVKQVYGIVKFTDLIDYQIQYTDSDGNEVLDSISPNVNNEKLYEYTLNFDYVHDKTFTLIATDTITGDKETRKIYFPPQPQKGPDSKYVFLPANSRCTQVFELYKNDDGTITTYGITSSLDWTNANFIFTTPSSYEIGCTYIYENGMLLSEPLGQYTDSGLAVDFIDVSSQVDPFQQNDEIQTPAKLSNVEYDVDKNGPHYTITVTLDPDDWKQNKDKWDYLIVYEYRSGGEWFMSEKIMTIQKSDFNETNDLENNFSKTVKYSAIKQRTNLYYVVGIFDGKSSVRSEELEVDLNSSQVKAFKQEYEILRAPRVSAIVYAETNSNNEKIGYHRLCNYIFLINTVGKNNIIQVTSNSISSFVFDQNLISTTNNNMVMDAGSGSFFVPIGDWKYGENLVTVNLRNNNGFDSATETFEYNKGQVIFNKPSELPQSSYTFVSEPTEYDYNQLNENNQPNKMFSHIYVSYLDSAGWHNYKRFGSGKDHPDESISQSVSAGKYKYSLPSITTPQNAFIKVSTYFTDGMHWKCSVSNLLYFNGTASTPSKDKLIKTGDFYFVYSDQPVYMTTVLTKHPLNECKDWTVEEWEGLNELHLIYNEQYINFTPEQYGTPGIYILDDRVPATGDCYVIIAHFADGHTIMSPVMIK